MPKWYVFSDGRQRLCCGRLTLVVMPRGGGFKWLAVRAGAPFAGGWAAHSSVAKQEAEKAGGVQSDETITP